MTFIGSISYSLYLWHWPVIILTRLGVVPHVTDQTMTGYLFILAASFAFATLSWRFVETPFRFGSLKHLLPKRRLFIAVGVSTAVIITAGMAISAQAGIPGRFSQQELQVAHATADTPQVRQGTCFIEHSMASFDKQTCLTPVSGKQNVLLLGDSHAAALWNGLRVAFPEAHILQANVASCHFTYGNYRHSPCSQMRKFIFEQYLSGYTPDLVILSERWSLDDDPLDIKPTAEYFQHRGIPVIVVGPAPEYTAPLPVLIALGMKFQNPDYVARGRAQMAFDVDATLQSAFANMQGVRYVSAVKTICPTSSNCQILAAPGVPLMNDVDHLSPSGSVAVIQEMKKSHFLMLR